MKGLLVVSAETATFFWPAGEEVGSAVRQLTLPLNIAVHRNPADGIAFAPPGSLSSDSEAESVVVERLGAHLPIWEDIDLLSILLRGFFLAAANELPASARHLPYNLYFPPWMAPRERRLLRNTARDSGLTVLEDLERGLALAMTQAQRCAAPAAGGWVIADRCGSDLDLYAIAKERAGSRQELSLILYRQCSELFSSYYTARNQAMEHDVSDSLASLPGDWPLLASDGEAASLLRAVAGTRSVGEVSFSECLARNLRSEEEPTIRLSRKWRYWLDHGDARLDPLTMGKESFPCRFERLFNIPERPPQQLYVGLRAGFAETRRETYEVCRIILSRPHDFHFAPGHLLVRTSLATAERGELAVEVLQHAKQTHVEKVEFPS
jgi:hypothetical protein